MVWLSVIFASPSWAITRSTSTKIRSPERPERWRTSATERVSSASRPSASGALNASAPPANIRRGRLTSGMIPPPRLGCPSTPMASGETGVEEVGPVAQRGEDALDIQIGPDGGGVAACELVVEPLETDFTATDMATPPLNIGERDRHAAAPTKSLSHGSASSAPPTVLSAIAGKARGHSLNITFLKNVAPPWRDLQNSRVFYDLFGMGGGTIHL